MACPNCGSWSVRADRSLAGRMVCGRCGAPLTGNRSQGSRSSRKDRFRRPKRGLPLGLHPAGWGLLVLLAIGAGLAWLEPPQGRQGTPLPSRSFGNLTQDPSSHQPRGQGDGWQPLNQ